MSLKHRGKLSAVVALAIHSIATEEPALAQPVPDGTLGGEGSIVTEETIRDTPSDRITGGATRGRNLFHSFSEFNVETGRGAYFDNPAGIENIFSRVTGSSPSQIDGRLGVIQAGSADVLGTASLFFMNPNGILFGPNASLDVGGSFIGTTANTVGFENLGFFSATNPENPSQLLTINPSAFFFNQVFTSSITNRSIAPNGSSPAGFPVFGLRVPDGESLLLLGGDLNLEGGRLNAFGGRIELGGLADTGVVEFNQSENSLSFNFPPGLVLADVRLLNDARVAVRGSGGGNIVVNSDELTAIDGGRFVAGVETTGNAGNIFVNSNHINLVGVGLSGSNSGIYQEILADAEGNTGNININSRSLSATHGGQVGAQIRTGGIGNTSDITIRADNIRLSGSNTALFNTVRTDARGNAGRIDLRASNIFLLDDALISSETFGLGRSGNIQIVANEIVARGGGQISSGSGREGLPGNFGAGGNITVTVTGLVDLDGAGPTNRSGIFSETASTNRAGDINLTARQLVVRNGAAVASGSAGSGSLGGDGGNIVITATDSIEVSGRGNRPSGITTEANPVSGTERTVNAGDLTLTAGRLIIRNGGIVQSIGTVEPVSNQEISSGNANAGDITLQVEGSILIENATNSITGIFSDLNPSVIGSAGNITIVADSITLSTGNNTPGQVVVSSQTAGDGNAGSINLRINGAAVLERQSFIFSQVSNNGRGNGGSIDITARSLSLLNGAQVATSLFRSENNLPGGQGEQAGSVRINASESINIDGIGSTGFSSGIFANTQRGASGRGGDIEISTRRLQIANGGVITAQTLNSSDSGDITINANSLEVTGGGQIVANTDGGGGNAGDIILNTGDIRLSGSDLNFDNRLVQFSNAPVANTGASSGIFATVETGSTGDGGNITVQANSLSLENGAQISAATDGIGRAGNITIRGVTDGIPTDSISLNNSSISTEVQQNGVVDAITRSNIEVRTRSLNLSNNATIAASTSNQGNAGNITIRDADTVDMNNSALSSTVNSDATGSGGNVTLDTRSLELNQASITASTNGNGRAGDVTISNAEQISLNRGTISTAVRETGEGQGGNISVRTSQLNLENRSSITSSTENQGDTGSITVTATEGITLRNRSNISNQVETNATGNSQRITLNTPNLSLRDNSAISAATDGNGRAGDIQIQNANTVSLSNSRISTEVQRNAVVPDDAGSTRTQSRPNSNQGNITIDTRSLNLVNGAEITASTNGSGRAGNVTVSNARLIRLNDESQISTAVQRRGRGRGGDVTLRTDTLSLNNSEVTASTNGNSRAGNITVNAENVEARNGGRLVSSTNRNRSAGTITLRELDNITLRGNNSGIFANTRGTGRGGRIELTTQTLNLRDQAAIATASQGSGTAGNIQITASDSLNAAGGEITTNAAQTTGGNITLEGGNVNLSQNSTVRTDVERGDGDGGRIQVDADALRLRDDSDIQTRVGPTGEGDGGDITVNADSVIAFDDSDIITESPERGGDINLNTPVFFGSGYVPNITVDNADNNGRVDLDASGAVSAGAVQTPDTSAVQNSLADLPANAIDLDSLIANSCIARTESGGTFLITGTGGLPTNRPDTLSPSAYPTDTVRTESDAGWQPGDPIVEPQGVYQLPNGELILSHECQ